MYTVNFHTCANENKRVILQCIPSASKILKTSSFSTKTFSDVQYIIYIYNGLNTYINKCRSHHNSIATYLAACTPSQVVLSLIKMRSFEIPSFSYRLMNSLARFTEPSTSNDNLTKDECKKVWA